jgi:hypothetical protein
MATVEQARRLLGRHGKLKLQLAEDWGGDFPLPSAVERYYADIGPVNVTIKTKGNPFFLPRLKQLWKFQDGYRFVGRKRQREETWDEDWLVVGDQGCDPLIVSRASGKVLLAEQGTGEWAPVELFPDLTSMAACLATVGNFDAGEIEAASLRSELAALLDQESGVDRVLVALGYDL